MDLHRQRHACDRPCQAPPMARMQSRRSSLTLRTRSGRQNDCRRRSSQSLPSSDGAWQSSLILQGLGYSEVLTWLTHWSCWFLRLRSRYNLYISIKAAREQPNLTDGAAASKQQDPWARLQFLSLPLQRNCTYVNTWMYGSSCVGVMFVGFMLNVRVSFCLLETDWSKWMYRAAWFFAYILYKFPSGHHIINLDFAM